MPKNALLFAATVMVENTGQVRSALDEHHALATELLGYEYKCGAKNPLATLIAHNPAKTATVMVAVALAALEGDTSKNTWRNPDADDVFYFTTIKDGGYTLSEVENIVLGITPEPANTEKEPAQECEEAKAEVEGVSVEDATPDAEPGEADDESAPVEDAVSEFDGE